LNNLKFSDDELGKIEDILKGCNYSA
jgi:hypothetical protein